MEATEVMTHLYGKTYAEVVESLSVQDDQGDCCGWADCEITDEIYHLDGSDEAVLVKVIQYDYSSDCSDRCVVNFIFDLGDSKGLILGYDLSAGSGSGWSYGAFVSLSYNKEIVASVSY